VRPACRQTKTSPTGEAGQSITITRDDWGLHVTGKTDADAVFGVMFAQARTFTSAWNETT
jgi:acyl-homoserine-lactone acylase